MLTFLPALRRWLARYRFLYWTAVVAAALATFAVAWKLDHSTVGLAIRATGDDETLAQVFGVRVKSLRVLVFGLGSAMAALSGALHAHRFGVYQPSDLGFHLSLLLFVYVVVGDSKVRSAADAEYFLRWLDRLEAAVSAHQGWNSTAERREVLAHIEQAREEFERRR